MADEPGEEALAYTKHQFQLFRHVCDEVEKRTGKKFKLRHCASTGATTLFPETHLDMVRPGLLLYGYGEFARKLGLKPVMAVKTTISTIKIYPKGTKISYGGIYTCDKTTRMGGGAHRVRRRVHAVSVQPLQLRDGAGAWHPRGAGSAWICA